MKIVFPNNDGTKQNPVNRLISFYISASEGAWDSRWKDR